MIWSRFHPSLPSALPTILEPVLLLIMALLSEVLMSSITLCAEASFPAFECDEAITIYIYSQNNQYQASFHLIIAISHYEGHVFLVAVLGPESLCQVLLWFVYNLWLMMVTLSSARIQSSVRVFGWSVFCLSLNVFCLCTSVLLSVFCSYIYTASKVGLLHKISARVFWQLTRSSNLSNLLQLTAEKLILWNFGCFKSFPCPLLWCIFTFDKLKFARM